LGAAQNGTGGGLRGFAWCWSTGVFDRGGTTGEIFKKREKKRMERPHELKKLAQTGNSGKAKMSKQTKNVQVFCGVYSGERRLEQALRRWKGFGTTPRWRGGGLEGGGKSQATKLHDDWGGVPKIVGPPKGKGKGLWTLQRNFQHERDQNKIELRRGDADNQKNGREKKGGHQT